MRDLLSSSSLMHVTIHPLPQTTTCNSATLNTVSNMAAFNDGIPPFQQWLDVQTNTHVDSCNAGIEHMLWLIGILDEEKNDRTCVPLA